MKAFQKIIEASIPYREQIQSKFERNQGMIELKLNWKQNGMKKID